jgi:ATP-binding cassette subfamily F protein 1
LKAGRITKEEFDKLRGINQAKAAPTEEQKKEELAQLAKESAVQEYKHKRGEEDSKSRDIRIEGITLSYKGQPLLVETDLIITHGRKYGLVGPNGSGKSTLLKHISMRHIPIPEHIQILHVEQEIEGTDEIAVDAVLRADAEREALLAEEKSLKTLSEELTDEGQAAADRLIEVYKRLRAIGSHTAEARASAILAGLQFTPEMQKKKTKEFSGGWRMRISLARALFLQPTLLLLDEPTNHLDLDASIWLETYLRKYKKTLLLVSHDREFLTTIVTDIIDLRDKKLNYYKGNYEAFEKNLQANKKKEAKERKLKEKEIIKAQTAQREKDRKKLKEVKKETGGKVEKAPKDYSVCFLFRDPPKLKIPVLQIRNASFHYPGVPNIFSDLELNIDCESKIAIVGPNGAGKSTLVNMILGELEPTEGEIFRNPHLRIAKFSQHFVDQLNMTDTPVDYINRKFPEMRPQEVRNKLGSFGLHGNTHVQPITLLSGGQKSRVCLCELSLTMPHILFLDEPTNHLDIQSVDALADALIKWQGGVIFITHDQRLVSSVGKELWVVKGDTRVVRYDGTFDDYKQELIDEMPDEWFLSEEEQ